MHQGNLSQSQLTCEVNCKLSSLLNLCFCTLSFLGVHLFFICFILSLIPDAGSGVEEVELSWEDYLEETGSTAVPYGSFKHVSIAFLFTSVLSD